MARQGMKKNGGGEKRVRGKGGGGRTSEGEGAGGVIVPVMGEKSARTEKIST